MILLVCILFKPNLYDEILWEYNLEQDVNATQLI